MGQKRLSAAWGMDHHASHTVIALPTDIRFLVRFALFPAQQPKPLVGASLGWHQSSQSAWVAEVPEPMPTTLPYSEWGH